MQASKFAGQHLGTMRIQKCSIHELGTCVHLTGWHLDEKEMDTICTGISREIRRSAVWHFSTRMIHKCLIDELGTCNHQAG